MVLHLSREPSARLLKHVVRCYLRLSDNPRSVFYHCLSMKCAQLFLIGHLYSQDYGFSYDVFNSMIKY